MVYELYPNKAVKTTILHHYIPRESTLKKQVSCLEKESSDLAPPILYPVYHGSN